MQWGAISPFEVLCGVSRAFNNSLWAGLCLHCRNCIKILCQLAVPRGDSPQFTAADAGSCSARKMKCRIFPGGRLYFVDSGSDFSFRQRATRPNVSWARHWSGSTMRIAIVLCVLSAVLGGLAAVGWRDSSLADAQSASQGPRYHGATFGRGLPRFRQRPTRPSTPLRPTNGSTCSSTSKSTAAW